MNFGIFNFYHSMDLFFKPVGGLVTTHNIKEPNLTRCQVREVSFLKFNLTLF